MRTTKPISTISFNTKEYLELKLKELSKAKIIEEWYFIEHKPEDDEGGKKFHFHVYIKPAKLIQTEDLIEQFIEEDKKVGKPRRVLKFNNSKFDDWYLYAIHDSAYLLSKGQTRRFHYRHTDIVAFDEEQLDYNAKMIEFADGKIYKQIENYIHLDKTFSSFVAEQQPHPNQVRALEHIFALLKENKTYRNGRETHSPKEEDTIIDKETGEVLPKNRN